jgi:hypothetical protein
MHLKGGQFGPMGNPSPSLGTPHLGPGLCRTSSALYRESVTIFSSITLPYCVHQVGMYYRRPLLYRIEAKLLF